MVSRALRTATVTLLVGCLTAVAVHAVENLEAGKSPSQIFAGTCNACHRSPRGLLKTVPASSLQGFLRQHYTTSSDMASVLSSFLISNGATDTRYQGKDQPKNDLAKQRDARQDPRQDSRSEGRPDQPDRPGRRQRPAAQETSPPEADGTVVPQGEGGRPSREARRHTRQGQTPDGARPADGQTPAQAATDSKPHTKQRLGKRGKRPAEEPPKSEETAKGGAAKDDASRDAAKPETETAKTDAGKTEAGGTSDAAKPEAVRSEGDKPETSTKPASEAGEIKSESAKVDAPKDSGGSEPRPLRPDPVPPASSTTSSGTPESAESPSSAPAPAAPPAATATAPATPSAPSAGSSPISR
jgi:hypothetical protein